MGNIRTLLMDSDSLLREGLKGLLDGSDFEVFSEVAIFEEARRNLAQEPEARLVLVDFDAKSEDGFTSLAGLCQENPEAKVVVLTSQLSPTFLAQALDAGAKGYLLKDLSSESLIQSLKLVMLGETVFPTRLAGMLATASLSYTDEENHSVPSETGLSRRETQVLSCLVNGHSNKVIGRDLGITDATVKVHLKAALRKINAQNRTQAAIWALNHGLGPARPAVHDNPSPHAVAA